VTALDPLRLTAREAKRLLVDGEISAAELTKVYLDQIAAVEGRVKAYIQVTADNAAKYSTKVDREMQAMRGPLAGLPIAVKDNMVTEGVTTTCASKILHNYLPVYTATAVRQVWEGHVVMLGKTNLDEFAMGSSTENSAFGPTRNPRDPSRVPGGSSGGSAAAVAAGYAPLALGSDTGGSIRQPAALCGITGLKPTYGLVSRFGMIAFASSLDQAGPMAPSAEDCALLLNVMTGFDPNDSTSLEREKEDYARDLDKPLTGLRVGLPKEFFAEGLNNEVAAAVEAAVAELKKLGATMVGISLVNSQLAIPVYYVLAPAEASSNLSRFDGVRYGYRAPDYASLDDMYCKTRAQGFGAEVKRRILIGAYVLSHGYYDAYYLQAQKIRRLIADDFNAAFKTCDVILGPTAPGTAFKLGEKSDDPVEMYLNDLYTIPANLAGLPGMSLPCGFDSKGLPIGLQLVGNYFSEAKMLNVAHQYQRVTDWHARQPEGLK